MRHLEIIKPSINRIKDICIEAIEHQNSWWEFKSKIEEMMKQEEKTIKTLSGVKEDKIEIKDDEPKCYKCKGTGSVYWNQLEHYQGPAIETGQDDILYNCDICNYDP